MAFARRARISVLIVSSIILAGAGWAQRSGGTANAGPGSLSATNPYGTNATLREAMATMQAKNYEMAERKFLEVLQEKPNEPRANLMLGVTEMALSKWANAKIYLTKAVAVSPREPDPKSRLAVTLIKLGDLDGAAKLRAELVAMEAACKGKCLNANWITDGLNMIDGAMATATATTPH